MMRLTHARFVSAGSQGEPCPSGKKEQALRGPERTLRRNWYASISLGQGQLRPRANWSRRSKSRTRIPARMRVSILGVTLVLPAIQSIELPRDYSRAEQAIAKRRARSPPTDRMARRRLRRRPARDPPQVRGPPGYPEEGQGLTVLCVPFWHAWPRIAESAKDE